MRPFSRFALVGLVALSVAACNETPTLQGNPPFTQAPTKMEKFLKPYEQALGKLAGPGVYGTALVVGPHFMPGACDGLWNTGDRRLVCDFRERYLDEPKEAKPDANMRFRCVRTLGGGTECNEIGQ